MTHSASAAALRKRIWQEVIAHGLCPGPEELQRGLPALAACGRSLIARELEPRLGGRLPGLYTAAASPAVRAMHGRVAAFSYLYCNGLQRALGHEPVAAASVAAALLSIAVCSIDRVVDGDAAAPPILHELAALGQGGRLSQLLPSGGAPRARLDHHELAPALIPCFAALDEFFAEVDRLLQRAADPGYAAELRAELIALLTEAATGELATRDLQFAQRSSEAGVTALRVANTLPQWIVAALALTPHPRPPPLIHGQLAQLTERLAEMMWILDDLADAAADLAAGRWSRVWLLFAELEPASQTILSRRDAEALVHLVGSDVAKREVGLLEDLLNQTRGYTALADAGLRELRGLARLMIWSWLAPEVIDGTGGDAAAV
jgi:hypothetical protein